MESRLLTVKQASKYLNYHPQTVREKIWSGEIPFLRHGKRGIRLDKEKLDEWIENNNMIHGEVRLNGHKKKAN